MSSFKFLDSQSHFTVVCIVNDEMFFPRGKLEDFFYRPLVCWMIIMGHPICCVVSYKAMVNGENHLPCIPVVMIRMITAVVIIKIKTMFNIQCKI